MTDVINEGFGATPPALLNAVGVDVMCRIVPTSPNVRVDILTINAASVQNAGAPVATKFLALTVIRSPAYPKSSNQQPLVPLRPSNGATVGLPGTQDISAQVEVLFTAYISVSNQGVPLQFERGELTASNGAILAVVLAPVVDGTTTPPSLRNDPVTLTVLGTTDSIDTSGISVATSPARSLPRYD